MAVDLQNILEAEIGAGVRRNSEAAGHSTQMITNAAITYLSTLDRVMLREYTEPSFAEAMAMREAAGSADAQRAMAIRGSIHVPTKDAT